MNLKQDINELLAKQGKLLKDLRAYIDMTDGGIRKIYARNSCEVSTLLKIAEFFDVPATYFFDNTTATAAIANGNKSVAAINSEVHFGEGERIKFLEQLLEEKERTINILQDVLSKKNQLNIFNNV